MSAVVVRGEEEEGYRTGKDYFRIPANALKFTLPKEHAHTRRCTSHCSGIAVMVQGHLRQAHTGALY